MPQQEELIHWASGDAWDQIDRVIDEASVMLLGLDRSEILEPPSPALITHLGKLSADAATARRFRHKLELVLTGYEGTTADLWDIPEVRTYLARLDRLFPFWFYYFYPEGSTLLVLLYSLCRLEPSGDASRPGLVVNATDHGAFLAGHFRALNELCARLGLPEEERATATRRVISYYGLR